MMAKFVSVIRSNEYLFERRQLPLQCDDSLSLVIQLDDACLSCSCESLKRKDLERFVQKFHALTSDELAVALMVSSRDVLNLLQQLVPCVGCRRSVERLLKQLQSSGHPALEPLIVTSTGCVSIKREYLFDPKAVFALFYIHGSKMAEVMESIPKSKKNKRCLLHSLDTHTNKTRTLGVWEEAWSLLSTECREEVVLVEFDALMKTLEIYLRKHRFCAECKSKVLRAYDILIEEVDAKNEKGYVASLFDGIRCCAQEKHLHVPVKTDYISFLIERAEPELNGSRRERHAKTLDIAQEEVLTCIGIHLYERLCKLHQKVKAEEQTWQILLFLGMDALRKSFDVALEAKQGRSNLELVCEELLLEEQAKEQKRELKRQKKKKKKSNNNTNNTTKTAESKCDSNAKGGAVNEAKSGKKKAKEVVVVTSSSEGSKVSSPSSGSPVKQSKCDENTNLTSRPCHSCYENHAPKSVNISNGHLSSSYNSITHKCTFQKSATSPANSHNPRTCGKGIDESNAKPLTTCNGQHDHSCTTDVDPTTTHQHLKPHSPTCGQPISIDPGYGSHRHSPSHRHHSDTGYCSGAENTSCCGVNGGGGGGVAGECCSNCSTTSSRDGSEVACMEGFCNHDGDSVLCLKPEVSWCRRSDQSDVCCDSRCGRVAGNSGSIAAGHDCRGGGGGGGEAMIKTSSCSGGSDKCCDIGGNSSVALAASSSSNNQSSYRGHSWSSRGINSVTTPNNAAFSLQDMLEETCYSGEEGNESDSGITEEEIQQYLANQQRVKDQRDRLRQLLRQRFANLRPQQFCKCLSEQAKEHNHLCE